MKIFNEIELKDFEPWAGAVERFDALVACDKLDDVENIINGLFPDGIGETEPNDFLWFEVDDIITSAWPAYYDDKYLSNPYDAYMYGFDKQELLSEDL